MNKKTWKTIEIGDKAEKTFNVSKEVVDAFSKVSLDFNPIHLDEEFAKTTIFRKPIVHGALQTSYISGLLANEMPGPGSIYVAQTTNFIAPLFVGDTVTVSVEVIEKILEKKQVKIKTICKDSTGKETLIGEAIIAPARK